MTLEDLSSASAQRNEKRMTDDVFKTKRIAHPPRVQPPLSSRESLSHNYDDYEENNELILDDELVSAKVSSVELDKKLNTSKVETLDDKDHVKLIMSSLDTVYYNFYYNTTPQQRAFVRLATCPPHSHTLKSLYSKPISTLLISSIISLLVGMLISNKSANIYPNFRGVSKSCKDTIDKMLSFV
jgi:hypothetical protein